MPCLVSGDARHELGRDNDAQPDRFSLRVSRRRSPSEPEAVRISGSELGGDQCLHELTADLYTIDGVDQLAVPLRLHDL